MPQISFAKVRQIYQPCKRNKKIIAHFLCKCAIIFLLSYLDLLVEAPADDEPRVAAPPELRIDELLETEERVLVEAGREVLMDERDEVEDGREVLRDDEERVELGVFATDVRVDVEEDEPAALQPEERVAEVDAPLRVADVAPLMRAAELVSAVWR